MCLPAGGKAVAAIASAEDGEGIVKTALDKFGGVHVLVANAGVARPSPFEKLSEKDWDEVLAVHLRFVHPYAEDGFAGLTAFLQVNLQG